MTQGQFRMPQLSNLSDSESRYESMDRVAQLLVDRPLLVRGRKFDIRCFAFVRSFVPFEAYMHQLYYARLANKQYDVTRLQDKEVAITVSAYEEDERKADAQQRLLNVQLRHELEKEFSAAGCSIDCDAMEGEVRKLLSQLFGGAARSIGQWPQCSAYYSVDVIFDNSEFDLHMQSATAGAAGRVFVPVPKLVEVNFMGDWHGVEAAVERVEDLDAWANDLMTVLATYDDVSSHPRLVRL